MGSQDDFTKRIDMEAVEDFKQEEMQIIFQIHY